MTPGICVNAHCPVAIAQTPLDRYPGPGEFCPECGDELVSVPAPAGAPFGGLSPLEALQRFDAADSSAAAPPRPARSRMFVITGGLATAIIGALVVAYGHSAVGKPAANGAIHVCRSTMTAQLASELVRAYSAKMPPGTRFESATSGVCDVRFAGATALPASAQLATDGIAVVVHPQNPLSRLSRAQIEHVFRGQIHDWSQLGGTPGPVTAFVPADGSDEAALATRTIMLENRFGARVVRLPSSADVVRAVAAANGRRAIGIVAFSGAVPAKVVAIGVDPPPSPISIADGRYPIALPLGMVIEHDVPGAKDFAAFVRSDDGRAAISRVNLVAKGDS